MKNFPVRKRKRSWLTFSLRTTLLLIGCSAVWLGWLVPRAQNQKKSADWARSFGPQNVHYGFQYGSNGRFVPNASPPKPKWLVDWLGIDYFSTVVMVHLDDNPIGDISMISNFHGLRHFELASGGIADVSPLCNLSNLRHLSLGKNPIDDISPLSILSNLKNLLLYDTQVKDVSPIAELSELEYLVLQRTFVKDLSPLSQLPKLTYLDISRTPIADISPLKTIKTLTSLDVSNTNVTGDDIDELQALLPDCVITR